MTLSTPRATGTTPTPTTPTAEHVSSTPLAVPTTEAGPLVNAPCGPVRGVWRAIVPAAHCPDRSASALSTSGTAWPDPASDQADQPDHAVRPDRPDGPGLGTRPARYERSAAFYNIPYAEAPVGEHRFMAPVPRARWREERDATAPGPTPQRGSVFEDPAIPEPSVPGEDMLNLNVFTPVPGQTGAGLPVYVWIHGGGWSSGCQASPWYDGAAFNRDGVVTVVPSYRLGLDGYGWVDGSDAPFNRGVLDQVLALEWVRDNIASFGGSPDHVTVGGQSAGGGNTLVLMAAPRAVGLFHRVISESGAVTDIAADRARDTARQMARHAGVAPTLEGWRSLDYDQIFSATVDFDARRAELAAQQAPPLAQRVRAALVPGEDVSITYGPTVDGEILPCPVREALAQGSGADIPLLAVSTTHEFIGAALGAVGDMGGRTAVEVLTEAGVDETLAADYVDGHPEHGAAGSPDRSVAAGTGSTAHHLGHGGRHGAASGPDHGGATGGHLGQARGEQLVVGNLLSDAMFHLPLVGWAEARLSHGGAAGTWLSRFAWESPRTGWSTHCFEVPFAFDCLAHPYCDHTLHASPPQSLADAVHGDWVRFISTGDPGWMTWDRRGLGRAYGDPRGLRPGGATDGAVYLLERRLLAVGERLGQED